MTELKRRTAEVVKTKAVTLKRKRIKETQRNRVNGKSDYTASTTLVFPSDPAGLMVGLKRELRVIASKISNDPAKLALLNKTYAVGLAHIKARYTYNKDTPALQPRSRSARVEADEVAARKAKEASIKAAIAKEEKAAKAKE